MWKGTMPKPGPNHIFVSPTSDEIQLRNPTDNI